MPKSLEEKRQQKAAYYLLNRNVILARQSAHQAKPEIRERARLESAKWYAANKERSKANAAAYFAKPGVVERTRAVKRKRTLERLYGVTPEQVEQMTNSQNHACAICFRVLPLVVDHNHTTGKVRGMLCRGCNIAIGGFRDCLLALESAKSYLQKHTQPHE